MLRLLTAAVLIPIVLAMIKLAPAWSFVPFAGVFVAAAVYEAYRMMARDGSRPFRWLGVAASLALVWSAGGLAPRFGADEVLVATVILTMVGVLWMRPGPSRMLATSVSTVFPVVVLGLMMSYVVALRMLPGADGEDLVMLLILCVALADTAAYYVGRAFGKRPLAPRVSPKKTIEGAAGAIGGGIVAALIAHVWFYQRLPLGHAVVIGVLIASLGILSDLAESMMKRATGVKDSSGLLPGHGGVLDRLDGYVLTAPVLFYYHAWFLGGAM